MITKFRDWIKKYLPSKADPHAADVERLRLDFKARYHGFKLLLNANNKALEIMADIERALQGKDVFGMSFVRSSCTAVSVNVFNMIKNLSILAPGKYDDLTDRFNDIRSNMDSLLAPKKQPGDDRLVISLKDISKESADFVGNKMANIGEVSRNLGIKTPAGFAVTAAAYEMFIRDNDLQPEIDRLFQSAGGEKMEDIDFLSSQIRLLIMSADVPVPISDAVTQARKALEMEAGREIKLAIRSSALGEDAQNRSFAGQYSSILNVGEESLLYSYKEVLASKYNVQAIKYRLNRGIRDEDVSMCVGCMEMVDAVAGGVVYSRSPVDGKDDSVFINSVWGLPKSVVDGSDAVDIFAVSRKSPMRLAHQQIAYKEKSAVSLSKGGVYMSDIPSDLRHAASVTEEQIFRLAEIALQLEAYYGTPQDIEWAVTRDGVLYILQCRPMQPAEVQTKGRYLSPALPPKTIVLAEGGVTASPGCASGKIFFVEKRADIISFPDGAVLVVKQALPVWASLLNRAAAVVSEQGGFAGHLANVAREFSVPALFGVKDAMSRLAQGKTVTVDADAHVIHKGKVKYLLTEKRASTGLMEGSPVFQTLRRISELVIPLNLIDPDASDFKPSGCRTLHDITRFIHEKSVWEMFNFGKEHNFSQRSSKQLYYKVPMKWWVLNLDDGFSEEVTGKYIRLENIASIPMTAFWEGFAAIPWEGPPPIDGKGLIAVMYSSTTNTDLNPGMRSKYADRNYFMISKNYCNLSSRLGYHFATMEALVDDRAGENYVSFQFKGGAADYQRRLKRVQFLKAILEQYDFRVEINEDNLVARLEGYDRKIMEDRLRILGYLLIHTRQLDMIMTSGSKVDYYRKKIKEDIEKILGMTFSATGKMIFT